MVIHKILPKLWGLCWLCNGKFAMWDTDLKKFMWLHSGKVFVLQQTVKSIFDFLIVLDAKQYMKQGRQRNSLLLLAVLPRL